MRVTCSRSPVSHWYIWSAHGASNSSLGVAACRGPDWPMAASQLSSSSVGAGPSRAMPSALAALRYFRTVFRDTPVPDAICRYPSPDCHRRMISCISTLVTSRYAIAAPHFRSAPMVADWLPGWVNDLVNFSSLPGQ